MECPSDGYLTGFVVALRLCRVSVLAALGWILLLTVLAAGAFAAFRWQQGRLPPPATPTRLPDRDNDLTSLGLSAVRPASAAPRADAPPAVTPTRTEDRARPVVKPRSLALGEAAPWADASAPLLLRSLSIRVGTPVAVVRYESGAYHVAARTDGGSLVPIAAPRLDLDGASDVSADALGGLATLVGGDARVVPVGDHLLLVGAHGAGDEALLGAYVDLLTALTPASVAAEPLHTAPEGADESAPVPRAAIIRQEQEAAAAEGSPLAFALVTLADAEERLTQHTPEEVARASSDLRNRLEDADHVRRVEPFGDLLFGVFIDRDPTGAATWCGTLSAGDPPLFIGAVAPADGEPTDVRDAAASALRDAYDQQRARIVEG